MVAWPGGVWRNRLRRLVLPLSKFQSHVLRVLAANRSADSYIAGGVAINHLGPRFSNDIDIFQDSEERMQSAVQADIEALEAAGLKITQGRIRAGKHDAMIEGMGEKMPLEWVVDADYRFFPTQKDDTFGYVLHPVDLATNKAAAAADRRVPRDIVDLVTIHENILPLGAVLCAAVGRFPGATPEQMLGEITGHSRFTAEEFKVLATAAPIDVPVLHQQIRSMIQDAEAFLSKLPSKEVGFVFLDSNNKPVQPDLTEIDRYKRQSGARRGVWPTSTEISSAMVERYKPLKP